MQAGCSRPSAGDGSLLARVRRLLGVAPLEERPAGGLAGTFVLAAVGLLGLALFLMPPASEARAAIDDSEVTVGTVETRDGKPAEGVEVWLVTMAYPGVSAFVTLAKARTDSDGRFRLVMNKHSQTSHKNGWRTIYAYKADYRPTAFDQPDTFGKAGFPTGVPIRLILEAAVRTTFGVCDDAGKPVAGAWVAIHFVGESPDLFSRRPHRANRGSHRARRASVLDGRPARTNPAAPRFERVAGDSDVSYSHRLQTRRSSSGTHGPTAGWPRDRRSTGSGGRRSRFILIRTTKTTGT